MDEVGDLVCRCPISRTWTPFADGFPLDVFSAVRREQRVAWHEGEFFGGPGYWNISKHEDIRAIGKNPALFSSIAGSNIEDRADQQRDEEVLDAPVLLDMGPSEHIRYRKRVNAGFALHQIARCRATPKSW